MKTLLPLLFILVLTTTAMSLDSHPLDAGALFPASTVAVLFAFALNDRPWRDRPPPDDRFARPGSLRSNGWAGKKMCVLCEGASS